MDGLSVSMTSSMPMLLAEMSDTKVETREIQVPCCVGDEGSGCYLYSYSKGLLPCGARAEKRAQPHGKSSLRARLRSTVVAEPKCINSTWRFPPLAARILFVSLRIVSHAIEHSRTGKWDTIRSDSFKVGLSTTQFLVEILSK